MAKVRIGFATTDGVMIDQHFGTARYWQIYDFGEDAEYVEDRMTRPSCKGHCEESLSRGTSVRVDLMRRSIN